MAASYRAIPNVSLYVPDGSDSNNSVELFDGINAEPALFLSGTTPVYSNNAFPLLGLALEKITGSDLETLYNESIVKALGLQHTSFTVPKSTRDGVIPGTPTSSGWDSELEALSA